jgi:hypothetical protein
MSKYIFKLKKKEIEIELFSSDSTFIARQMKLWQDALIPGLTDIHPGKAPSVSSESRVPAIENIKPQQTEETTFPEEVLSGDDEELIKETGNSIEEALIIASQTVKTKTAAEESSIARQEDLTDVLERDITEKQETLADAIQDESSPDESLTGLLSKYQEQVNDIEITNKEKELSVDSNQDYDDLLQDVESTLKETVVEDADDITKEIDEDPDIRFTERVDDQQDNVISDEMEDISALLADFEDETKTTEESESADEEGNILDQFGIDLSEEPEEAEEPEYTEESENIIDQFGADFSVNEEDVVLEEQPTDEEIESDDYANIIDQFESDIPENKDNSTRDEDFDLADQFLSEVEPAREQPVEDEDFDAVISAMAAEIEEEDKPVLEETVNNKKSLDDLLEGRKEIPEPVRQVKQDIEARKKAQGGEYRSFINNISIKTPVDLLVATAFFMEKLESKEKFTTKEISNKTQNALQKQISPAIFLAAVNKGFIEVVPDFTGTAESNEYTLTGTGRSHIQSLKS